VRFLALRVLCVAAEVDSNAGLVAYDPRIVSRGDRNNIAWPYLALCPIVHADPHAARDAVHEMRGLAAVGLRDRLDITGPGPAWLERAQEDRMAGEVDDVSVTMRSELSNLFGRSYVLDREASHVFLRFSNAPANAGTVDQRYDTQP